MKKIKILTAFWLLLFCTPLVSGQAIDDPVSYLNAINDAQSEMNQKYMAYMSAAAHSRKAKRIEKLRQQVLESINNSRVKTAALPYYKGDNSLRQSSMDYIKLCYNVFNEDYARIVNMEEIAEQSFDEMQAFLLLHEKTGEKITEASEKMNQAIATFAAKNNVTLIESSDEFGLKLRQAGKLNRYSDSLFLIFFKCYWQDGQIVEAMNKGSVTQIEQGRASLIRFADEGLAALQHMKPFNGDGSLIASCKRMLTLYKQIAEKDIPVQADFFIKKDNFEKVKKSFDAKSARDRTKEDVAAYNKSVNEINAASDTFNKVNKELNDKRNTALNEWNKAQQAFADDNMPHYKKRRF